MYLVVLGVYVVLAVAAAWVAVLLRRRWNFQPKRQPGQKACPGCCLSCGR